ncbi:MAG: SBBP repeat-containing protein [Phycisphaerae bacterium]|nr:SBBP repeat-containing protein [Phycisphaerae bacterium]
MKNTTTILLVYCLVIFCICRSVYAWSDKATHAAITEKAVQLSTMDNYFKNQLGISQGLSAEFQTIFYPALEDRMADLDSDDENAIAVVSIPNGCYVYTASYNVRKFSEDTGRIEWTYYTGGTTYGITVDDSDNVYVAGVKTGSPYASVWKLDSTGEPVWTYDTTGNHTHGIAVDDSGNVYVAGYRAGLPYASVWKLNSAGELVWTYDTSDTTTGIAVDKSSNVYVAGYRAGLPYAYKIGWKLDYNGNLICAINDSSYGGGRGLSISVGNAGKTYMGLDSDYYEGGAGRFNNNCNPSQLYNTQLAYGIAVK